MNKKILFIGPYPEPNNGISHYTSLYAAELRKSGFQVRTKTIYVLKYKWHLLKWILFLPEVFSPSKLIIQYTPTITGPGVLPFLWVAKILKKRVHIMAHEPPSVYAKHLGGVFKKFYLRYEGWVAGLAAKYIVHTEFHKKEMDSLSPVANFELIPIPLFGEPVNHSKTRIYWCFYGLISPKKNLELVLEAYQSFPAGTLPPLKIIGGPAPGNEGYFNELAHRVQSTHQASIQFLGFVTEEEKKELFGEMSLVIYPYRWISQSAALAETCLHGIPFLASDVSYFKEFQEKYGCGWLFEKDSVESLKGKMKESAQGQLKAEQEQFTRVYRELSLESCVGKFEEIL